MCTLLIKYRIEQINGGIEFMRVDAKYLKYFVALVILIFVVILIFDLPQNQLLTNDELNTLLSEKEITPISTNDVGDSYTVIIYKDEKSNELLELIVYKNSWGKIKTKQYTFYESDRIDKVDVEYWGTNPFSYNLDGYVGIEILNKDMLNEAKSAEVILDNGLVMRAKFHGSNLLQLQAKRRFLWEKPRIKSIEIYNDKGDVIHGFYS
jgi:hypothetical protein